MKSEKPKVVPIRTTPAGTWETGYSKGFKEGFDMGLKSRFDIVAIQQVAFEDGVRHIVTLAEDILVKELGLPNRIALSKSPKLPAWWISTLVTNFVEREPLMKKQEEGEHGREKESRLQRECD